MQTQDFRDYAIATEMERGDGNFTLKMLKAAVIAKVGNTSPEAVYDGRKLFWERSRIATIPPVRRPPNAAR
jgi:hypothetical protein